MQLVCQFISIYMWLKDFGRFVFVSLALEWALLVSFSHRETVRDRPNGTLEQQRSSSAIIPRCITDTIILLGSTQNVDLPGQEFKLQHLCKRLVELDKACIANCEIIPIDDGCKPGGIGAEVSVELYFNIACLLGRGRGVGVDWCCCSGGVNDRHTVRLVDVRAEGKGTALGQETEHTQTQRFFATKTLI